MDDTLDAAGHHIATSATRGGVTTSTTYTFNELDQTWNEVRTDGSTTRRTFDPAGNTTDSCYWQSGTAGACDAVGTLPWTNPPTQSTTTLYDARNNRIGLTDSKTSATTVYDAAHDYQVSAVYTPTVAATGREYQVLSSYDDRDRLTSVTHQLCVLSTGHACSSTTAMGSTTFEYDANDNRTRVNESTSVASLDRYYCYDANDRVLSTRSASGCSSGLVEAYTYDDSGNRTAAGSTTFAYDAEGQLSSCSAGCGTIAYDAAGRTSKWNGWAFEYDADGRMVRACQSSTDCAGLYNEVEYAYDGDGHRTKIIQYNAGSGTAVATREFRYQGDAIVEEKLTDGTHAGVVVRSYVVDESGSAVKLKIAAGETGAGDYFVTWNGHGDALGLWAINPTDGTLSLANSFTYGTWGAATVATHNGYADLGFRFRYVGEFDVQWDDTHGLGLYYLHARHYSPSLGRFLQPDPDRSDANLYSYTSNNPVTEIDPDGNCWILCQIAVGALIDTVVYFATTDKPSLGGLVRAVAGGAVESAINPFAKLGKAAKLVSAAGKILNKFPRAARAIRRIQSGTRSFFDHSRASERGQIREPDVRRAAAAAKARASMVRARLKQIEWRGGEIRFGDNFRIKPFPSRGRTWPERLPHYHRRVQNPATPGEAFPGQGIGRHRPWESSPTDRHWRDRF
jgi:RHS repeat-associated protein